MELIKSLSDFEWYKASLDVKNKHKHRHFGEPSSYPCKVESVWEYSESSADHYVHLFFCQQKVICESCGHETIVWPDEMTEKDRY